MNETAFESSEFGNSSNEEQECKTNVLEALWENGKLEIPLYSAIFFLAVVGNVSVILTLAKNRGMRTNTNVFLLNLAVSDLILAVLCMPFTLVGTLLRDFVFGEWMCKLVPFFQGILDWFSILLTLGGILIFSATSVAASVWTLVALSVERYYAICHPLRSRRWQTLSHAYNLIGLIWAGGAVSMLPIPILSELQPTNKGHHKCRESWPKGDYERAYNLFLDVLLLVVPLSALAVTYYLIAVTLWRDCAAKPAGTKSEKESCEQNQEISEFRLLKRENLKIMDRLKKITRKKEKLDLETGESDFRPYDLRPKEFPEDFVSIPKPSAKVWAADSDREISLRQTNYEKSLTNKRRVIKMLFVVVLEFFICWTPLYVVNTLALFWPQLVYETVGYKTISFCHLLAYTSGCCNPITYCFMNKGFRTSFIHLFGCCKTK